ncbi:MAG: polysaccharide deacetylase family protein [Lewinellaceae bacterium]|nr:polysaccharide deacetylase family protein [Lewinellaceae bacterium]
MLKITTSEGFFAEKHYCFRVLFGELLGLEFRVVTGDVEHYRIELPNGKTAVVEDHFFGKCDEEGYLNKENIPGEPVSLPHPLLPGENITGIYGKPYIQISDGQFSCGIDLFASCFFMLTRWEEYVLPDRDAHGRFPASASLAWRGNFLNRPVVNEYAALLRMAFERLGFAPPPNNRTFRLHLSHDVDHPKLWWSAAGRIKTPLAALLKRGNLREAAFWLREHSFRPKDPYDIFDEWMDLAEQHGHCAHFNFLGERAPSSNCYYPLHHPFVKNLIRDIAGRGHVIGFHPSYEAYEDKELFLSELASLQALCPAPVTTGRQHFLRFAAPDTWQRWEDAGMEWDSTLGYAEEEGFRCGICCDFPVFNFLTGTELKLREKPLIAMDVTLAMYRRYDPATAFDRLQHLRHQVEKHKGEFVLLWHNSSWNTYFWAPRREMYRSFIAQ